MYEVTDCPIFYALLLQLSPCFQSLLVHVNSFSAPLLLSAPQLVSPNERPSLPAEFCSHEVSQRDGVVVLFIFGSEEQRHVARLGSVKERAADIGFSVKFGKVAAT